MKAFLCVLLLVIITLISSSVHASESELSRKIKDNQHDATLMSQLLEDQLRGASECVEDISAASSAEKKQVARRCQHSVTGVEQIITVLQDKKSRDFLNLLQLAVISLGQVRQQISAALKY